MSQVTPCCQPIVIPGTPGRTAARGIDGTNGKDAYTELTSTLTMPAELGSVIANVVDSSWAIIGLKVWVGNLGTMAISAIPSATQITLVNLQDTPNNVYMDNAAPGTITGASTLIVPTGGQGPPGNLAGAGGGDLEGTYPNPTLAITTTIGDLIVNANAAVAPRNTRLAMGTAKYVLHAQTAGSVPTYLQVDLSGTATAITGQLPLANGGTGHNAATLQALLDYLLSILTTKGDIAVFDGTNVVRFGVAAPGGYDGLLLGFDSTTATGLKAVPPAVGSTFVRSVVSAGGSPFTVPVGTSLVAVNTLPCTIDLLAGAGYGNKVITVKDIVGTAAANPITIQSLAAQNIEGAGTYLININRGVARLYFDATAAEWKIV